MRRRGNQYRDHLRQGQPPVLTFSYDILLDGREMDPPTNFYLARIRDRRTPSPSWPSELQEKRRSPKIRFKKFTIGHPHPGPRMGKKNDTR